MAAIMNDEGTNAGAQVAAPYEIVVRERAWRIARGHELRSSRQ